MNGKSQKEQGGGQPKKINLENVDHAFVVMSGKGGVGKSTVSANLAASLAKGSDKKIGVLDADIHGPNIPKILGVEDQLLSGSENRIEPAKLGNLRVMSMAFTLPDKDSPVIWRGPLKMKAIWQFLGDVNWGN